MNFKTRMLVAMICMLPLLAHAQTYSRTETIEYHDDLSLWVVGQVKRTTTDGVETSRTDYGWGALPWKTYTFGRLDQTLAYDSTSSVASGQLGTLKSVTDGRNKVTTLINWHRGIPQLITFEDGYTISAVVNDLGEIDSTTDQNGYTTGYLYDPMGRLRTITPPTNDDVAWLPTVIDFKPSAEGRYGLPAGHWLRSESRGSYRKETHYDALWRPVIEREYDASTADTTLATQRIRGWVYDAVGQVVFESYPVASLAEYSDLGVLVEGISTTYDALGRAETVTQHSELGLLVSSYNYLSGFKTAVTNARGHTTTSSFQVFDVPDTSQPVHIDAPEGATTSIDRDVFGKPKSITRSGIYQNGQVSEQLLVTRSYVYDEHQRLCRVIEPEIGPSVAPLGSTVMDYDAASNLLWSASGLNLPVSNQCERSAVDEDEKVYRTYDDLNRLVTLRFPYGLGDQDWQYTPDGLPERIETFNDNGDSVVNEYFYNKLRLLRSETMSQPGRAVQAITYAHTPHAHLKSVSHPSGLVIDYAPNALGQPKRASSFATSVSYYPNGAMAQFVYGNGLIHTLSRNERGLPKQSQDANLDTGELVLDDTYLYDKNGNVRAIEDALPTGLRDRVMQYDQLDRLTEVDSLAFGAASYRYDPVDNLRTLAIEGDKARVYTYDYDAKQRLGGVQGASVSYTYDVQGNLSTKNGQNYRFDFGNRLREVEGVESYRYDGHGRRVRSQHVSQGAIYSLYGQDGVLRNQRDERSGEDTDFVYLNGSLIAQVGAPIAPPVVVPTTAPNLTAPSSDSDGSYSVSWTGVSTATRYELEEQANGGAWSEILDSSALSKSITGKGQGSYGYRVRACNTVGCGPDSTIKTTVVSVVAPPPGAPSLTAPSSDSDGNYSVSWTSVSTATRYELEEQTNGGTWSEIQDSSELSKSISGKGNGSYGYRVRACNTAGCGPDSTTKTTVVSIVVPPSGAPNLTAPSSDNDGSYSVSWSSVSTATRYELEEQTNGGTWAEIQDSSELSKSISGKGNGSYGYRVRACNSAGCGPDSSVKTTVVSIVVPPPTPTLTAPSSDSDGSYIVSWNGVSTATRYELEEQTNGGTWSEIQDGSGLSKSISGKGNGSYGYRVRACNTAGCGPDSAIKTTVVSIVVPPPSGTPTLSTLPVRGYKYGTSGATFPVDWTSVTGATSYTLEEQINGGTWKFAETVTSLGTFRGGKAKGSYAYRVKACNSSGCSAYSNVAPVTVYQIKLTGANKTVLSYVEAPSTASASFRLASAGKIRFQTAVGGSWVEQAPYDEWMESEDSAAASYFQVRATKVSGSTPAGLGTWKSLGSTADVTLTRSSAGTSESVVKIEIREAESGKVFASQNVTLTATVNAGTPPAVPLYLDAVKYSTALKCSVNWNASAGATRYELMQSTYTIYNGSATGFDTSQASPSYACTLSTPFKVRACNAYGCSAWSATVYPSTPN